MKIQMQDNNPSKSPLHAGMMLLKPYLCTQPQFDNSYRQEDFTVGFEHLFFPEKKWRLIFLLHRMYS